MYCSATLAFLTMAFFQKVVKIAESEQRTNHHITHEPLGNSTWNQKKQKHNTVACFCTQEDVTVDTFFLFRKPVSYLTRSW